MGRKTEKQIIGKLGEDIACRYLQNKGYSIFTRNFLRPWGEIDIVAVNYDGVHFVEVKTVTRETITEIREFRPEDNVHSGKLERLGRVIQTFISEHYDMTEKWQLDVLTVTLCRKTKEARVELIENVIIE